MKKYALKRGAIAFGKLLPVGIGAVIGGVGNRVMGKKIIANARLAFGNPPPRWPSTLHVLPPLQPVRDARATFTYRRYVGRVATRR